MIAQVVGVFNDGAARGAHVPANPRKALSIVQGETGLIQLTGLYIGGTPIDFVALGAILTLTIKKRPEDDPAIVSRLGTIVATAGRGRVDFPLASFDTRSDRVPPGQYVYEIRLKYTNAEIVLVPQSPFFVEQAVASPNAPITGVPPVTIPVLGLPSPALSPAGYVLTNQPQGAATWQPPPGDIAFFYPQDYGSVGAGSDSATLQATLDAVKAAGGGLVVLTDKATRAPLAFVLDQPVFVDLARVTASIEFMGAGSSFICGTGNSNPSLRIANSLTDGSSLVTFRDIHLVPGSLSNAIGVQLDDVCVRLEQVLVKGLAGTGFLINGAGGASSSLFVDIDQAHFYGEAAVGIGFDIRGANVSPARSTARISQLHAKGGGGGARAVKTDVRVLALEFDQCVLDPGSEAAKIDQLAAVTTRIRDSRFPEVDAPLTELFFEQNAGTADASTALAPAPSPIDQFSAIAVDPATGRFIMAPIGAPAGSIVGSAATAKLSANKFLLNRTAVYPLTVLSDGSSVIAPGDYLAPSQTTAGRLAKVSGPGVAFSFVAFGNAVAVPNTPVVALFRPGNLSLSNTFRYVVQPGDGDDFVVPLPNAQPSTAYAVLPVQVDTAGGGFINIKIPDNVGNPDRTQISFRVQTSAPLSAGDTIDFLVLSRTA